MYHRRISSNLGYKIERYGVLRLDRTWNARDMKARCQAGIAYIEGVITMASGIRIIELGDPEDARRASLRVEALRSYSDSIRNT